MKLVTFSSVFQSQVLLALQHIWQWCQSWNKHIYWRIWVNIFPFFSFSLCPPYIHCYLLPSVKIILMAALKEWAQPFPLRLGLTINYSQGSRNQHIKKHIYSRCLFWFFQCLICLSIHKQKLMRRCLSWGLQWPRQVVKRSKQKSCSWSL